MFSMVTSRTKSWCDSWWSKVSSASCRSASTGGTGAPGVMPTTVASDGGGLADRGSERTVYVLVRTLAPDLGRCCHGDLHRDRVPVRHPGGPARRGRGGRLRRRRDLRERPDSV